MLIEALITFTCTTSKKKDDCLEYMRNCVYNESIIDTYDPIRQRRLTVGDRHEDCHNWEVEQRKEGKYAWQF